MDCQLMSQYLCCCKERHQLVKCCYDPIRRGSPLGKFYCILSFCGFPVFITSIFFNVTILIAVIFDPIITIGTFCNVVLPASKNLLNCYNTYSTQWSEASKLNGPEQNKARKQCRGVGSCLLCWLPILIASLIMVFVLPLGLLADLFLQIFSLGRISLALSKINVRIIKTNCTIYSNMVQGEDKTNGSYADQMSAEMKSFSDLIEQI